MKYLVLIPDGMADLKIEQLGDLTPMEAAKKPTMEARHIYDKLGFKPTGEICYGDVEMQLEL